MSVFYTHDENGYVEMRPGIERKTLVHGEKTLLGKFRLAQGSTIPRHAHPYEQTGYLIAGRLLFSIGAETFAAGPGDSWCIPSDVTHGVVVLADAVLVEVFAPARPDYLPAGGK